MTEKARKNWLRKIKDLGDVPTPFMLTDLSIVEKNAKQLKDLLDNVKIYYAVKSNPDPVIVSRLSSIIDGFDIASLGEWEHLRKLDIAPDRILFSNSVKVPGHIKKTFAAGVDYFAVDSVDEIKKISELAPSANIYLRVQISNYGSKLPFSKKYGVLPMHVAEYASLAESLGLKVRGFSFHVGSQAENLQLWENAFKICGELIGRLRAHGMNIDFLDIGGGFPADYGQPTPSIKATCEVINKAIKKHIPKDVEIVAEPGRFIVADSSVIGTEIITREHRSGTDWLHLDMGVFQGLMEILEMKNWRFPIFADKNPRGYKKDFALAGPSCDTCDTIGLDYTLPSELNRGDKLYIGSAGAYTTVYGSNFNGFEMPRTYYIG